jgi:hypothetical protein
MRLKRFVWFFQKLHLNINKTKKTVGQNSLQKSGGGVYIQHRLNPAEILSDRKFGFVYI